MESLLFLLCFASILVCNNVSGLRGVAFLRQPQNGTALEGSTHIFECAINNSDFNVIWHVNGIQAKDINMRQRGFRVDHITQTRATLTAVASPINNNSYVYCMALWVGVNSFVKYESKTALFMIKALPSKRTNIGPFTTPASMAQPTSHTPLFSLSHTKGVVSSSLPSGATSSRTASHSALTPQLSVSIRTSHSPVPLQPSPWTSKDQTESIESKQQFSLVVVCTASLVPILVVMCLSALLLLLGIKKWKKKAITDQDPETSPNVLYEVHKPMRCKGNQAYETVSATAPPWPVEMDSIAQQVQEFPEELHVYEEI